MKQESHQATKKIVLRLRDSSNFVVYVHSMMLISAFLFCIVLFHFLATLQCNTLQFHPFYLLSKNMAKHLNLISWHVKGLNHPIKRKKVFTHLKHLKAEIAFLQETQIHSLDNDHLPSLLFLSQSQSGFNFYQP